MLSTRVDAHLRVQVDESATQTGIRQAAEGRRKVAQPGRWLSQAKYAGRGVGKSAPHVPQRRQLVRLRAYEWVILRCLEKLRERVLEPPVP
jgi:hypothetical protein